MNFLVLSASSNSVTAAPDGWTDGLCFLSLVKKGCSDSSGRFWSVFGSLPKNLWTTCMLISGLPFKIAFEPGNFSSFRTSPKIQDSDYVHRMLLCLSLGVFSPDSLSRVKGNSRSLLQMVCLLLLGFPFFSSKVASSLLVDKLIALMAIFFSLGP